MPLRRSTGSHAADETRERLLGAAEALFIEQGFASASLRAITSKAGANLAAVNYHFGSKEGLIRAVLARRLEPLNGARVAYLDDLERRGADRPPAVEEVLEALLVPALHLSERPFEDGAAVLRLLGRAFSEPAGYMKAVLPAPYESVAHRFHRALARALPELPDSELVWRMHFTFGAIAYVMGGNDSLRLVARCEPEGAGNPGQVVRRLVQFLAAGFRAPAFPIAVPQFSPETSKRAA